MALENLTGKKKKNPTTIFWVLEKFRMRELRCNKHHGLV